MKIIFLDIDGVLCNFRASVAAKEVGTVMYFDPVAVQIVNRLCEEQQAKIVVSSTWRNKDHLPFIFRNVGLVGELHVDWRTPKLWTRRGYEIQAWLDEHPEVERYVILDDDSDMLEEQMPFFVKTSTYNGLLFENYLKARRILSGDDPSAEDFYE